MSDLWFDVRHGTSTSGWIAPDQLDATSDNVRHSLRYQATRSRPFVRLLKRLSFPDGSVFVDVGCGKGKAMLIASRFGFRRILGVEFSPELCRIARRNAEIFQMRTGKALDMEVIDSDVVEYPIPADSNVFYLYNSFDDVVLRTFLHNIRASLQERPRKVWLIYHIATHGRVVEEEGIFTRWQLHQVGGTEFVVYESA